MKKYTTIALLILFIFGTMPGSAQTRWQTTIDSLVGELTKAGEDTNKVSLLNQCAYLISCRNPKQGLTYSSESIKLAERLNWQKGLAVALDYAALCSNIIEDSAHARSYALRSVEIARNINDIPRQISAITRLGYIAYRAGQKKVARGYGQDLLKLAGGTTDTRSLALAYMHLGFLLDKKKEFTEAVRYDSISASLFASLGDKYSEAGALLNIETEYYLVYRNKDALAMNLRVLAMLEPFGNTEYKAIALVCISDTYDRLSDYSNARKTCLEALEIDKQLGQKVTVAEGNTRLAMIYFKMEFYTEARRYATTGLEMALATGDTWYIKASRRLLKKINRHIK